MDTLSQVAFSLLPSLSMRASRQLLDIYNDPADIFHLSATELKTLFPRHPDICNAILHKSTFSKAEQIVQHAEKNNIRILFLSDSDYPQRLNSEETTDCPILLYAMGNANLNTDRTIAIVGTRKCTAIGKDNTENIVRGLVSLETSIISGLAYGIDTAAHQSALDNNLPTVAVLGHGLDRIYPPANRNLAQRIIDNGGALLTEYPIGTHVNPGNFPARNRIIAALGDATVVVEAAEKGGALITATISASYNRLVFALPGRLTDTYSKGTNALVATNKASLVRNADDIAFNMGWALPKKKGSEGIQQNLFATLTAEEEAVLTLLRQHDTLSLDEISHHTNLSLPQTAAILFNLEMNGSVGTLPGHLYRAK